MLSRLARRGRQARALGLLLPPSAQQQRESSSYRVVVVGGGVVGTSILYHLARNGWTDVALIERAELTAGSTWHAAAGFHAQNKDSNIASLQAYTVKLYDEIQKESGIDVGLKRTGGFSLAGTPERWESLKTEWAHFKSLGHETHLVTPAEVAAKCPIVDVSNIVGGLYDPSEGRCDPHGTTHAYAGAAKSRGAQVILQNRVLSMKWQPEAARWLLETEKGPIDCEHVVNAGGLWARKVGEMVGLNLPVTPMQHHYLITEDVPEILELGGTPFNQMPSVTDLEGFTYLQQERGGVLLGIYERTPRHWNVRGAPWDYGQELIPEEVDRISDELSIGLARFPALERVGIRKWVNGAFTFTPDGNPIVGPVGGLKNYWVACGCMAGFSQGGGVGLALANWMTQGDPGFDVFGMDVARYGPYAAGDHYLRATTEQFYSRRFVLSHPNEELPAGRPLKTSPVFDLMQKESNARFGVTWGMEFPQYFATNEPDFVETPTERRSDAEKFVAKEVEATRTAAGLWETAIYARYEVSGPGAAAWLDNLFASKLPSVGRVRLATMLKPNGYLHGDLSLMRLAHDKFWVVGSYYLQAWHGRWFESQLPTDGSVQLTNLSDRWMGFSLSGPKAREILSSLVPDGHNALSNKALPFMAATRLDVGPAADAVVARISLTGEMGYEVTVPTVQHRALWKALMQAGEPLGMRQIGNKALESLRHEKAYGIWSTEFTQEYTPAMCGLDRFIDFDKEVDFVGKTAALREKLDAPPKQRLVQLSVDSPDADARMLDPIWLDGKIVGFVTSGAYGHHVKQSLALGYVDNAVVEAAKLTGGKLPSMQVHIVGEPRPCRILLEAPYDPKSKRLRG